MYKFSAISLSIYVFLSSWRIFCLTLFWPWCIYSSCFTRAGRLWWWVGLCNRLGIEFLLDPSYFLVGQATLLRVFRLTWISSRFEANEAPRTRMTDEKYEIIFRQRMWRRHFLRRNRNRATIEFSKSAYIVHVRAISRSSDRKLKTSKAPLEGRPHGTTLYTRAVSSQMGCQKEIRIRMPGMKRSRVSVEMGVV